MKKKSTNQNVPYRITRNRVIIYAVLAVVIASLGYYGWYAMIPANGTVPVFAPRDHHFIKALHSKSGYYYLSTSSGSVKGMRSGSSNSVNPTYLLTKDDVQSVHFINEDRETHSVHNLNIDAFNVHTRNLGYFESQTVDFIPDKEGTFEYYCSIHPEMKGEIEVTGHDTS